MNKAWQLCSTHCIFNVEISVLNLYITHRLIHHTYRRRSGKGIRIAAHINGQRLKVMYVMSFKRRRRARETRRTLKAVTRNVEELGSVTMDNVQSESESAAKQRGDEISRLLLWRDKAMHGWIVLTLSTCTCTDVKHVCCIYVGIKYNLTSQ